MNAACAVSKMMGLMFGWSVLPSKSLSTMSSIETYSISGFAAADSPAAAARANPTVMISLQPSSTRLCRLGA